MLIVILTCLTEDLTSPFPLPLTSLAPPNAYTVNAKGKRVKDNKTTGPIDMSVSKALAPARTGWTGGWGTGTTSQGNGGGPDVGTACIKLMGRAVTMLAPAKDSEVEYDLVSIVWGVELKGWWSDSDLFVHRVRFGEV